ncbi:MAG: outer membrane protein assembly factor BamB family protein, partial [Planctomycetota bacterium]
MIHRGLTISSLLLAVTASQLSAQEWNQWRGPMRDGLSPDTGLAREWPEGGPAIAWKTTGLGQSFSSVSFYGDKIFTMGDVDGAARLFALNGEDGKVLWSAEVGTPGGVRNPGPRGTPATDGEFVYTLGHDGELVCSDIESGKKVWACNLISDYGGKMMSRWGYSESPLLDGDLLVVTPGGSEGSVLALNKKTGEPVWRCTELTDAASYASL